MFTLIVVKVNDNGNSLTVPSLITFLLCSNQLLRTKGKSLILCSEEFVGLTYMGLIQMNVIHSSVHTVV